MFIPYFHFSGAKLDAKLLLMVRSCLSLIPRPRMEEGALPPNSPDAKGSQRTATNCPFRSQPKTGSTHVYLHTTDQN